MGGGYNNEFSKEEGNKPPDPSESSSKSKKDKNMNELDLQKREVAYQNVEMDAQAINSKPNEAQGVSAKGFPIIIKDLTYRYNLNLCVLLETHVSGSKAEVIIRKLGFDSWCRSEAEGFAGGIWCLWNKKEWNIEPLKVHKQFIHLNIKDNENRNWYCTCVYGSPQPGTRSSLWEELENFAATIQGPWCVGGDFNSIISLEETGGSFNLSQDSRRFQDCIQNCGLKDLGFSGPPFTWQRNRVKRRLDQLLCNLGFNDLFPSAGVKHLPKLKSDHIPILLDFNNLETRRRDKPFRLLAPWLLHEDY
nr:uncharacterized protein LOC114924518 [Arachis hypogaea]